MKKYLLFATAVCAALAACTKNEVKPVEMDQEITYQTITTKAASSFASDRHFTSYAYAPLWEDMGCRLCFRK